MSFKVPVPMDIQCIVVDGDAFKTPSVMELDTSVKTLTLPIMPTGPEKLSKSTMLAVPVAVMKGVEAGDACRGLTIAAIKDKVLIAIRAICRRVRLG